MSDYEIFILGGSFLLLIGLVKFFASVTTRKPIGLGVFVFAIGGGLLVYANTLQPGGMLPSDVPNALFKLLGRIF